MQTFKEVKARKIRMFRDEVKRQRRGGRGNTLSSIRYSCDFVMRGRRRMSVLNCIRLRIHLRKLAKALVLPGPPHWDGDEGGCLGLPTDVAKLILKWV